jgi:hypothetical protein
MAYDFSYLWLAGELGFEPRQTESESVVLPLHHSPRFLNYIRYLTGFLAVLAADGANPRKACAVLPVSSRPWQARGDAVPERGRGEAAAICVAARAASQGGAA